MYIDPTEQKDRDPWYGEANNIWAWMKFVWKSCVTTEVARYPDRKKEYQYISNVS